LASLSLWNNACRFISVENLIPTMSMRKLLLILLAICLPLAGISQKKIYITGNVTDKSGHPLAGAHVYQKQDKRFVSAASNDGVYHLTYTYVNPEHLVFQFIGYKDREVLIDRRQMKRVVGDTLYLNVRLEEEPFITRDVVINSVRKPDTVFGSARISVSDFEFYGDRMVLLTYERTLKHQAEVVLTDKEQNIVATHLVHADAESLFKDFRGNVYVICKTKVLRVHINKDELDLHYVSKEDFDGFHSRVLDSLGSTLYFSNFNDMYPAFQFYANTPPDSVYELIHKVEDDFMMELYRSEYKWMSTKEKLWAFRQEVNTGIDKEIWAGARYFTTSLYYQPLYAPLYVQKDTIFIFDHYVNKLYKLDERHVKVDSVTIGYHLKQRGRKWEQPLIEDKKDDKFYTAYMHSGYHYITHINTNSGATDDPFKLYFQFVEKVRIHNGYVYYIFRPFESLQKKFIYRQLLAKPD